MMSSAHVHAATRAMLAMAASLCVAVQAQGLPLHTVTSTEIGLQLSGYRYEEDDKGAFFMALDGRKLGITLNDTRELDDDWFMGGELRYAGGNVDYTSASSGNKGANADSYLDFRFTLGRDFRVGQQLLAPFGGLGYRYLNNDLRGYSTTGAAGYRRTSNYAYLPLGLTHRAMVAPSARFATTIEYDYLIQGIQRSYMTDLGYNDDLYNTQRNGHGLRMSLAYETEHWSAGVFYHYWNIQDSDVGVYTSSSTAYSAYEPHNITREIGLQLKFRFR